MGLELLLSVLSAVQISLKSPLVATMLRPYDPTASGLAEQVRAEMSGS